MICPGTFAAKATAPCPLVAVNSVMNSPPPETARVIAPHSPRAPAVAVVVRNCTLAVIHDSSPGAATITSPASSPTSSTGMVVPVMRDCMAACLQGWIDCTVAPERTHCQDAGPNGYVSIRRGGDGAGIAG